MSDENGDGHKTATVQPPLGRPFAPGHDPRRNAGGRPRGLAAAARAAIGNDGSTLIDFFMTVLRGDGRALGVRQIPLAARLDAARWLADGAYGKPPQTVEIADVEREQQAAALHALAADFTPEEKATIRAVLLARRERYLAVLRQEAEAKMRSYLPTPGPDGNGDGLQRP